MTDSEMQKAAKIIVEHSTKIKKDETVQIIGDYDAKDMVLEVFKLVLKKGAYPRTHISLPGASYIYYKNASKEQLKRFPKISMHEMKNTDATIFIGAPRNIKELANIDPKKIAVRQKVLEPIFKQRSEKTKWVIYYHPTPALAQEAGMSAEEFREFVYKSTLVDFKKMEKQQEKLKKLLDKGKSIRIVTKNTDIKFNIAGRKGIKCCGEFNLPDGEVFTSPVENSAEGYIEYSYPSIYQGNEFQNVKLEFRKGKAVKIDSAKNTDKLKHILNTDKGARFVGEIGIGTNYNIQRFVKNTLFDEKIGGTIHIALGKSYKEAGGKNESAIHWDMITSMRKGGRLYIDKKLVQKDGKFLI